MRTRAQTGHVHRDESQRFDGPALARGSRRRSVAGVRTLPADARDVRLVADQAVGRGLRRARARLPAPGGPGGAGPDERAAESEQSACKSHR